MKLMSILEAVEEKKFQDEIVDVIISFEDDSELMEQFAIESISTLVESVDVLKSSDIMFEGLTGLKKGKVISNYGPKSAIKKQDMIDELMNRIEKTNKSAKAGKLNKPVKIATIAYITTKGKSSSDEIWSRTSSYYAGLSTDPKDIEAAEKRLKTNKDKGQISFVTTADGSGHATVKLDKITGFKFNNGKLFKIDNSTEDKQFPDFVERLEKEAKIVGKVQEEATKLAIKALSQFEGAKLPTLKTAEEFEKSLKKKVVLDNSKEKKDSIVAKTLDKERRVAGKESPSENKWYSITIDSFKDRKATVTVALSLVNLAESLGATLPLDKNGKKVFSKNTEGYEDYKSEILSKIGKEFTITARGTAWTKATIEG